MAKFDKWTLLKLFEVLLVLACLVFKRVTDDEARSVYLYLQKLSREWSLLNNVTWDRVGASVADATYGGYLIITIALFVGRIFEEIPTRKRITEFILLGVGAILFIALGSLSFASLDSVPHNLIDNAAILGTISLVTGALFLLDMGGPKAKKHVENSAQTRRYSNMQSEIRNISRHVENIEKDVEKNEQSKFASVEPKKLNGKTPTDAENERFQTNGVHRYGVYREEAERPDSSPTKSYTKPSGPLSRGYKQMVDEDFELPRRFGVFGKDAVDYPKYEESETDEPSSIPPKMEQHSPVWSHIRKGLYGKYGEIVAPPMVFPKKPEPENDERPPSGPGDPGYVQYTAQHWGEKDSVGSKTPRHSPTEV